MAIKDSTILITGANRGIGKAYAEAFLKAGAKKIYLGVRNLHSVHDLVNSNPDSYKALELDVTDPQSILEAKRTADDVNILVNNAGVAYMGPLLSEGSLLTARSELDVNYFGPLSLIHAFTPIIKANGGGTIANISSIGGIVLFPGAPTYCASKAAMHFLTQAARMELAHENIHVIGVYPGPVDTDMAADIDIEKVTPMHIALETIKAIDNKVDQLFPDPYSKSMYEEFCQNPEATERKMVDMYNSMKNAA